MTQFLDRCKILSGSMLKVIALVSMFIDHLAYTLADYIPLLEDPLFCIGSTEITLFFIMRRIGRLAFPIFCFLIAEGIVHTRDIRVFGARLLGFALVSEVAFDMMMTHSWVYIYKQNVFFTLFLGVLMVYVYERINTQWLKWLCMVAVAIVAMGLRADYGLVGVLLIFVMYLFREQSAAKTVLAYPLLGRITAMAAFVPIFMYNGKRGFIKSPVWKYVFYAIYPLHMALLAATSYLLYVLNV